MSLYVSFSDNITDSYNQKQCIDNCIEKHLHSFECIPNPFINHSFVLIDSNQNSIKICENLKNITIDSNYCLKDCPKHCSKIYSILKTKTTNDNFNGDSYLKIFNDKAKHYNYQAEGQLSLTQYIADLGGLFGLYLGISLIDMGKVIKNSIFILKKFFNYIKELKYLKIIKINRYFQKINKLLNYLHQINFSLISKIIFNPILFFELFTMINLYFQYSTQTNYEFIPYNISDDKYSLNEFPSITICNEQLFDKIWFNKYYDLEFVKNSMEQWVFTHSFEDVEYSLSNTISRYCEQSRYNLNDIHHNITNKDVIFSMKELVDEYHTHYLEHLPMLYGTDEIICCDRLISMTEFIFTKFIANGHGEFINRINQFEDKHSYGLSPLKQLFDFYGQHYRCVTDEPSIDSRLSPTLSLLSPSGKCHTFLSDNNINQTYVKSINIFTEIFLFDGQSLSLFPHYLSNRYYLQDRSGIPSNKSLEIIPIFNYMHNYNDMSIELKKIVIKRLEKPYDTECQNYGDSNQINCMNKCLSKKYQNKFNCLPSHNKYHTMVLNFSEESNLFCPTIYGNNITQFETFIQTYCNNICGNPCEETLFKAQFEKGDSTYVEFILNLFFKDKIYAVIEYTPNITFMEFLVNIFNIWNLWHGTSLKTIITILSNISKRIVNLFHLSSIPLNKKILIKIISFFLAILFSEQILSKTIEHFQFKTITKINLIDSSDDNNYPYVSFVLNEDIPYFPIELFVRFKNNSINNSFNEEIFKFDIISKFSNDKWENINYTTVELAEFVLGHFNVTKNDLFDKQLLSKNLMTDISIIPDNDYSISYYTNFLL